MPSSILPPSSRRFEILIAVVLPFCLFIYLVWCGQLTTSLFPLFAWLRILDLFIEVVLNFLRSSHTTEWIVTIFEYFRMNKRTWASQSFNYGKWYNISFRTFKLYRFIGIFNPSDPYLYFEKCPNLHLSYLYCASSSMHMNGNIKNCRINYSSNSKQETKTIAKSLKKRSSHHSHATDPKGHLLNKNLHLQ